MKMLHKSLVGYFVNKTWNCKTFVRKSALFINGAKATENFVYVVPYIDFSERIKQKDVVQDNLFMRKSNVNLKKIENLWLIFKDLEKKKMDYDKHKEELSRELGKLTKNFAEADNVNKLKIQISLLKENIKKLKVPLWSAEEAAVVEALKLPNDLHHLTPVTNKVLYTHLSPPTCKKDHLKIGKELGIVDFKKNENYYLTGDGAVFELGAKFYFNSVLKNNGFVQFSNPDFVKSVIVEGCGINHTNADDTFILHHNEDSKVNPDSRLHLTGGGSLYSFFAYHAKNVLHAKKFPLKYFAMGRQYIPSPVAEDSLFHVSQSSVVHLYEAAKTASDLDVMLHETIDLLKSIYKELGYHFRLSFVSADKLFMWESLRVVVEMYSMSLNSYVEVANLSVSGDFISKRLMLMYVEDKHNNYPHIISGTVLNVPKFLACVMEQDNDFSVPEKFKVENWIM